MRVYLTRKGLVVNCTCQLTIKWPFSSLRPLSFFPRPCEVFVVSPQKICRLYFSVQLNPLGPRTKISVMEDRGGVLRSTWKETHFSQMQRMPSPDHKRRCMVLFLAFHLCRFIYLGYNRHPFQLALHRTTPGNFNVSIKAFVQMRPSASASVRYGFRSLRQFAHCFLA